jgi:hypothetical protein
MAYIYAKIRGENIANFISLKSNVDSDDWWLFIYELTRIENKVHPDPQMELLRKDNITFLTPDLTTKINLTS